MINNIIYYINIKIMHQVLEIIFGVFWTNKNGLDEFNLILDFSVFYRKSKNALANMLHPIYCVI